MKIYKTKQGKEFVFNNKFAQKRISSNDRKLNTLFKIKYKLVTFFHLKRFIKKKSWYTMLDYHWGRKNRLPNSSDKKRLSQSIRLSQKDLKLQELVIYDLIPREYLDEYKRKYFKFKNAFAAPTITSTIPKEIHDRFFNMENSQAVGSWHNVDHFLIKSNTSLGSKFYGFQIEFFGLTESFYIVRYVLNINDTANNDLEKILRSTVYKEAVCFSNDKWWKKKGFGGCHCYDIGFDAKFYTIEDYILELKALFWKAINKYLRSFFFNWDNIPPSIEIYSSQTVEKNDEKILEILAQRNNDKLEYCESHKTYFIPSKEQYRQKPLNNSKIVADYKQFESDNGLYDFLHIEETVCQNFAEYFVLDGLSYQTTNLIYQSQRKVNRNIYRKSRLNSLLNIKSDVEKEMYFYRRLYNELHLHNDSEDFMQYKFNEYKKCFVNVFAPKNPKFALSHSFENMYKGIFYNIKEKYTLIEAIYAHFDENAKIVESRYNYRIVKWTLIVAVVSLLATILLSGEPCLAEQAWKNLFELFTKN